MLKLRGDPPKSLSGTVDGADRQTGDGSDFSDEADRPAVDFQTREALREWRRETAEGMGVPPFYVLSNSTIEELAAWKPDSRTALLEIKGIGPAKLEQFGDGLLSVIEGYRQAGEEQDAPAAAPDDPDGSSTEAAHYWTWRLFDAGFSLDECMAIRNIDRETVWEHAVAAAEDGLRLDPRRFFAEETLKEMEASVGEVNREEIELAVPRLLRQFGAREARLYLACRAVAEDGRPSDAH